MARYTGPKCRLCRREGSKLFLKGDRCETQKCAMIRKNYTPGLHGRTSLRKHSEYGKQLREKQKAKRIFGIKEKPFRIYAEKAIKQTGIAGENLLRLLETRLDNAIYRSGIAASRDQARQMVSHGLFKLNGKRVTIPSIKVKVGDKFSVKDSLKKSKLFEKLTKQKFTPPKWIKVDYNTISGEITAVPNKEDFEKNINTQSIIEFYSK